MGIAYNTSIVRDGLVLHLDAANVKSYPGSGTVWNDLSGNGYNAIAQNGPLFNTGNKGYFSFDGLNDRFSVQKSGVDLFGSTSVPEFTYAAVGRHDDYTPNEWEVLVGSRAGYDFQIGFKEFTRRFAVLSTSSGTIDNIDTGVDFVAEEWFYLLSTYNNGVVDVYLNGELIYNVTTSGSGGNTFDASQIIGIGAEVSSDRRYLHGDVALAQIYNRALSAQEVRTNFEALRGRYGI